jgi:peroxiredoxin
MSLINQQVIPFKATAYHNGKFVPVSEESFKGKWSVVVFYPADFTFVCPTELGDLADNYAEFKKLGVEIYGVSTDTHFTHKAWHDTSDTIKKVQYPLIGDPNHQLASYFQVLITEGEDAGLALRGTFVIDPRAASRRSKCTTTESAATPGKHCAASGPPSTSPPTPARCARPSGRKAPPP